MLRFTARARRHLNEIAAYIGERNPQAAQASGARLRQVIELLSRFPYSGREGTLPGTREMAVPGLPYLIVYQVASGADSSVVILGIYHGARERPGQKLSVIEAVGCSAPASCPS
jgi:toxin ParE1/3/4